MTRRVVVLGDVGGPEAYHLGDEAMLEAALGEVDARLPVQWTVVSANPAESARRDGVAAVARIGFAGLDTVTAREARLARGGAGRFRMPRLDWHDPATGVLDAVAAADAVLIATGGNLDSRWPEHIYERAALAAAVAAAGKPVIVTGQGLGPQFTGRDGELVAAMLAGAHLVGVRERRSAELAGRLGVPTERIWCATDDATFLPGAAVPEVLAALDLEAGGFVAASRGCPADLATYAPVCRSIATWTAVAKPSSHRWRHR
jgi:polysaccharide pyruvyl transferase WcaK-like protein